MLCLLDCAQVGLVGECLMCASIVLLVLPQTPALCASKVWSFHIGFCLLFGSVLVRLCWFDLPIAGLLVIVSFPDQVKGYRIDKIFSMQALDVCLPFV